MPRVYAIVPSAGKGTRLGMDIPKALTKPTGELTLIEMLYLKIHEIVDKVIVVASPGMQQHENWPKICEIEVVTQDSPTGMGDAVFTASRYLAEADVVIIIWADQVGITRDTVFNALRKHAGLNPNLSNFTIPLLKVDNPYVEYVFHENGRLEIKQTREGEDVSGHGFTDVGVFVIDSGDELLKQWDLYKLESGFGDITGERNFLPFLSWLSRNNWHCNIAEANENDRLNINTFNDFELARKMVQNE
jgi:bifunctional UDP-N-acetylglucosamine pyrophosphorylase / glucosamine-1-phosphate N-acetyltransferase